MNVEVMCQHIRLPMHILPLIKPWNRREGRQERKTPHTASANSFGRMGTCPTGTHTSCAYMQLHVYIYRYVHTYTYSMSTHTIAACQMGVGRNSLVFFSPSGALSRNLRFLSRPQWGAHGRQPSVDNTTKASKACFGNQQPNPNAIYQCLKQVLGC